MKKKSIYLGIASFLMILSSEFLFGSTSLEKQGVQQKTELKRKQWLWNTTKVFGPLAVMGFAAYQLLKSPSESIELPKTKEVPTQQQPLTKEQYEKYKNAANRFGYTTVFLSWAMLLSGSPLFVPFIAVSYGGALYNGMKGLQLKLQPYLYPISLEQIHIEPAEMPY